VEYIELVWIGQGVSAGLPVEPAELIWTRIT
jgi:hypothetical protein